MSKTTKKLERGNRNITDFFARQSSISTLSSQPPSSQPSSSQPTPSQKPASKPALKRKGTVAMTDESVAIQISSDSDPVYVKTNRSHISISSSSHTDDSFVVVGPSVPSKPKVSTAAKAAGNGKKTFTPTQTQSSAKTTVKRRAQPAVTVAAGTAGSSARPAVRRKRKLDWDDSSEDEMFKPNPDAMKAELTRAPVPRVPASPSKSQRSLAPIAAPSSPASRSSSSKRRRITPRDVLPAVGHTSGEDADVEEVPSSVSDEQELVLPNPEKKKDPKEVQATVDSWRRATSVITSTFEHSPPPSDYPSTSPTEPSPSTEPVALPTKRSTAADASMDVDMTEAADLLQGIGTQGNGGSEYEVSQQLNLQSSSSAPLSFHEPPSLSQTPPPELDPFEFRPVTPPPAEPLPPLPPTPVALNVETKTAQAIARIKALAEAAVREQQDKSDDQIQLGDLSDDSDLESLDFNLKPTRNSRSPQPLLIPSSPLTSMATSPEPEQPEAGPSTRYNLRRRSSPHDKSRRSTSPDSDLGASRRVVPVKKRGANPLDKLLREKKNNDKHGKGIEGIRLAEAALRDNDLISKNKGKMREEMDMEEDSDDDMWADEEAAARVARQGTQRLKLSPSNFGTDDSDSEGEEGNELDIAEATKHLGDEQGAAVGKILDKDRKGWLRKGKSKKNAEKGLLLWAESAANVESTIEDDSTMFSLPFSQDEVESDRVLTLLQSVVNSGDVGRLASVLSPHLLARSNKVCIPKLVAWVFSLLLYRNSAISRRAYECLLGLASRITGSCAMAHPFTSSLVRLGAKADTLGACDRQPPTDIHNSTISVSARLECLSRMVGVVKTFAQNGLLPVVDIPDIVMALLLVGFDLSTTAELRSEIIVSIDVMGLHMPSFSSGSSDMEPVLCARILEFTKQLSLANKTYLLMFFCGASPQMARIKRWLAHGLLLGTDTLKHQQYTALPPLEPFVEMLSPVSGSKTLFDVAGGAEEDDYFDNLSYYVEMLNSALNDVPAYVREEKRGLTSAGSMSAVNGAGSSPEKPKTELQQIKHCLEVIHGKIVDTRAAHLDRSRVKAAIQQLSFRVHYQREATLKASRSGRPPGLRAYFPIPKQSD